MDGGVVEFGKDSRKVIADWDADAAAGFATERMAATLGPACRLPMWIQFLRPSATVRMEFSARLLLNSSSGCSRKRVNLGQSASM